MKKYSLLLFLPFLLPILMTAQDNLDPDIKKTIILKDSLLFNVGFNTCNINMFEKLYGDEFTFFHDKDGISNKKEFINNLKKGLCNSPEKYQSRRELIKESTKLYPLFKDKKIYGVIQTGIHNFYEKINKKPEKFASSANFIHVWLQKDSDWILNKSLSYNHKKEHSKITINPNNTEELRLWLKEKNIPILGLGIINQGQLQEIRVIGDLKADKPAPYNTIFNVASLTKPVTAMVTLQLVSMGKWDLDEPIHKYWIDPDLKNDKRINFLTTRHILSHQTGFPNWRSKKLQFQFTPGTRYQYSGEGYEYLRKALENKFKKSLNKIAEELIFEPLKMKNTQYCWNENIHKSRVAPAFDKNGNLYKIKKYKKENAADNLLTTIEDYCTFLISVMNGNNLTDEVYKEMLRNQVKSTKGKHFGLGFEKYHFKDGNFALSHGGADKGVHTLAVVLPKTKQGILIYTNVDDGYKVYEKLLTNYLGEYGREIIAIETQKN